MGLSENVRAALGGALQKEVVIGGHGFAIHPIASARDGDLFRVGGHLSHLVRLQDDEIDYAFTLSRAGFVDLYKLDIDKGINFNTFLSIANPIKLFLAGQPIWALMRTQIDPDSWENAMRILLREIAAAVAYDRNITAPA